MRYSALLPTRNGGKFLRNCIESILSQDYDAFELVISDNANSDETPAILDEYKSHPKVRAIRLDHAVPVTDNWNAAYNASSGDYVLMMGDDDYLLPDYFRRMDLLLERHSFPDCVLYNGYSYVAPGSFAGDTRSFYSPYHFRFGADLQTEQELDDRHKFGIVRDMFEWKPRIPLNMQTTLVARRAADRLEGGFFQPPFPDHYALNALLLNGSRWVFTPDRLVIVGVSPKSFGHFHYSNKVSAGNSYLGIDPEFPGELPGSTLLNGMHMWLNRLIANFPDKLQGVRPDRAGYVRRQLYNWIVEKRFGAIGWSGFMRRFGSLRAADWAGLAMTPFDAQSWRRLFATLSPGSNTASAQWKALRPLEGASNIAEFAARLPEDQELRIENTFSSR
jgi:glycosyltransferase involved in cell wall biosynthesis